MEQTIGEQIRTIRKREGVRQQDLADECRVGRTYISYVETGRRLPSFKLLNKIMQIFDYEIVLKPKQ
jgi:transcriptional regulator with XRE-family HTH domain